MPRYIYKYCCGKVYDATHNPCPVCHGQKKPNPNRAVGVISDEIDETHENLGHEPVHFSSRAEKRRYLKEHGIEEFVRHRGVDGTDKSPNTTRWI